MSENYEKIDNNNCFPGNILTIEEMNQLAIEVGMEKTGKPGRVISKKYINAHTPLKWGCGNCNYIFDATPNKVKSGRQWCPRCAGKRYTKDNMIKLAIEVGMEKTGKPGKFISREFTKITDKHNWQCGKCGCIFSKTPNKIKSRREWCSKCSGKASPTIKELEKLAFEVGVEKTGKPGKFISKKFTRMDEKHIWECGLCRGRFHKRPNKVKFRRSWCQNCSQGYYEKICIGYMVRIFSYIYKKEIKFPKSSLDCVIASKIGRNKVKSYALKHSKHNIYKMHIDGFNAELGIGVERNGRQHYEIVDKWHNSVKVLENQISIDNFKIEIFNDLNFKLFIVGFETRSGKLQRIEPEEMQDYIINQYKTKFNFKNHDIPKFNFKDFFVDNPQSILIHINTKQLDVMRELDGKWHFITDLEKIKYLDYIYGVRQVVLRLHKKGYLVRKKEFNPNSIGTRKIQNLYTLSELGRKILGELD